MKTLTVHAFGKPVYDILFSDNFQGLTEILPTFGSQNRKICIVSESRVADIYLSTVKAAISPVCPSVTEFVFPEGESQKNLSTVGDLYECLIQNHFDRKDLLVALGGGVVGDLTGYTAATYLRGIDFIQIQQACWPRWTAVLAERPVSILMPTKIWWALSISQNSST